MQHSYIIVNLDNQFSTTEMNCSLLLPCAHSFEGVPDVKSLSVFQCKCAQYWPDQGCWTYGNIRVSVEDTMVLVDYTVRKFCIQQVISY